MNELNSTLGTSDPSVEQAGQSRLHGPAPAGFLSYGALRHPMKRDKPKCLECGKSFVSVNPQQTRCRVALRGTIRDLRNPDRRRIAKQKGTLERG